MKNERYGYEAFWLKSGIELKRMAMMGNKHIVIF